MRYNIKETVRKHPLTILTATTCYTAVGLSVYATLYHGISFDPDVLFFSFVPLGVYMAEKMLNVGNELVKNVKNIGKNLEEGLEEFFILMKSVILPQLEYEMENGR